MDTRIIVNASWGSTNVEKIYQGSELVWPLSSPIPTGPGPDIMLNWISNGNDRTQPRVYFDTKFPASTSIGTCVEVKYSYNTSLDYSTALFGASNTVNSNNYNYTYYLTSSSNKPEFKYRSEIISPSSAPSLSTPHIVTACPLFPYSSSNNDIINMTIDGSTVSKSNPTGNAGNTPNLLLFAVNWKSVSYADASPSSYAAANTRIYYVKIYGRDDNNILYRFLIPVLHYDSSKQKYVACFYDKVSNTYFYNKGTDNVSYSVQGDVLLDYIERDNSGYLTYTTEKILDNHTLANMAFTVGDSSVKIEDLGVNPVFGANTNNSSYGYFLPTVANQSRWGFNYFSSGVGSAYDSSVHISENHHSDHFISYCMKDGGHFTWLYVSQGDLPNTSTRQDYKHTQYDSLSTFSSPIVLFGTTTQHAVNTTKIFYADFETMTIDLTLNSYKQRLLPGYSYIPVLHNNNPCFYDCTNKSYIYNTGTGTPAYLELS